MAARGSKHLRILVGAVAATLRNHWARVPAEVPDSQIRLPNTTGIYRNALGTLQLPTRLAFREYQGLGFDLDGGPEFWSGKMRKPDTDV